MRKMAVLRVLGVAFAMALIMSGGSAFALVFDKTQAPGEAGSLEIVPSMKGTDIIVYPFKMDLWNACVDHNAGRTGGESTVKFNGDTARWFGCWRHDAANEADVDANRHTTTELLWGAVSRTSISQKMYSYYSIGTNENVPLSGLSLGGSIEMKFGNAAEDLDGHKYDMHITMSDIKVKVGAEWAPAGEGGNRNSMSVAFGYNPARVQQEYNSVQNYVSRHRDILNPEDASPVSGLLEFSAFSYYSWASNLTGVKYKISIRLTEAGTNNVVNKRMLWGFNDVDIIDKTTPAASGGWAPPYRDQDGGHHEYAEHVTLLNGFENTVSVTSSTQLAIDGNTIYHYFVPNGSRHDNVSDNSTDMLFITHSNSFDFEWGGSGCSTQAVNVRASRYHNKTTIKLGNDVKANNADDASTVIHDGNQRNISFIHNIVRDDNDINSPGTEAEAFYILNQDNNGIYGKSAANYKTMQFSKGQEKTVYTHTFPFSLEPNRSAVYGDTLYFRRSNLNNNFYVQPNNGSCTLYKTVKAGMQCIRVRRPPAMYNADIGVKVWKKNSSGNWQEAAIPANRVVDIDASTGE